MLLWWRKCATGKIRIDQATQQASVIDVIRLITTTDSNGANKTFQRLEPEIRGCFINPVRLKFSEVENQQGLKLNASNYM